MPGDAKKSCLAGASATDISPLDSLFLYGYPHVERYSEGIHDPLLSSSLYVTDGAKELLFISNDIIFLDKALVARVRSRVNNETGVPTEGIMVTASHTHSGPKTIEIPSNEGDPVIPPVDGGYVSYLENQIVSGAVQAFQTARPARVGLGVADATGIGTHRHDPEGPSDLDVPVLMVREKQTDRLIACMLVCAMHPTVLHEDSKQVSGGFPAMARQYLQAMCLGKECPVIYHMGASGNQSPRHVTRANTFEEAERLGKILGEAVEKTVAGIEYSEEVDLDFRTTRVDLPRTDFPSRLDAQTRVNKIKERLEILRKQGASRQEIRTLECDSFGAEETLQLTQMASEGRLEAVYESCLPAEIQLLQMGRWQFVGWPGEIFVEYALAVKKQAPNAQIISLANGDLQVYVATPEAAEQGWYEACNALFSPESGQILVEESLTLIHG